MSDKTESVQLYVDAETKQALRRVAAENQESMAAYVRAALKSELADDGVRLDD